MLTLSNPKFEMKPVVTKDADFSYNRGIETRYNAMLNVVANRVEDILAGYSANDPMASVETLQELQDFSNDLYSWASDVVSGLLYSLNEDDKRTWQRHSAKMSRSLKWELEHVPIRPRMEEYLRDNVGLIQSMPLRAAERVQQIILKNLWKGEYRADALKSQIMRIGHVTKSRAQLIARTETARISTGLTQVRCESLNIPWYVWRSSHDVRVRSTHAYMDRVLIKWSDPPSPEALKGKKSYGNYHAGCTFNCRCYAAPLLRISDITFPAKIHINGQIVRMNQNAFMRFAGSQIPMAG